MSLVYGPTDNTNYTIWSQAENIRSRPEEWEESVGDGGVAVFPLLVSVGVWVVPRAMLEVWGGAEGETA